MKEKDFLDSISKFKYLDVGNSLHVDTSGFYTACSYDEIEGNYKLPSPIKKISKEELLKPYRSSSVWKLYSEIPELENLYLGGYTGTKNLFQNMESMEFWYRDRKVHYVKKIWKDDRFGLRYFTNNYWDNILIDENYRKNQLKIS